MSFVTSTDIPNESKYNNNYVKYTIVSNTIFKIDQHCLKFNKHDSI